MESNSHRTSDETWFGVFFKLFVRIAAVLVVGFVLACLFLLRERSGPVPPRGQCAFSLSRIGAAMRAYHQVYGCFPPAYLADDDGRPLHSWRVLLLPYLGGEDLHARYNFDEPWDGPNNILLLDSDGGLPMSQ